MTILNRSISTETGISHENKWPLLSNDWPDANRRSVHVIDQSKLPHVFETTRCSKSSSDAAKAIKDMIVRGAPLIGVTGAYGLALAAADDPSERSIASAYAELVNARPTAVNLRWALDRISDCLLRSEPSRAGRTRLRGSLRHR